MERTVKPSAEWLGQKLGVRSWELGKKQFEDEVDDEHEDNTLARWGVVKVGQTQSNQLGVWNAECQNNRQRSEQCSALRWQSGESWSRLVKPNVEFGAELPPSRAGGRRSGAAAVKVGQTKMKCGPTIEEVDDDEHEDDTLARRGVVKVGQTNMVVKKPALTPALSSVGFCTVLQKMVDASRLCQCRCR
jgi:hypothetical protein